MKGARILCVVRSVYALRGGVGKDATMRVGRNGGWKGGRAKGGQVGWKGERKRGREWGSAGSQ